MYLSSTVETLGFPGKVADMAVLVTGETRVRRRARCNLPNYRVLPSVSRSVFGVLLERRMIAWLFYDQAVSSDLLRSLNRSEVGC